MVHFIDYYAFKAEFSERQAAEEILANSQLGNSLNTRDVSLLSAAISPSLAILIFLLLRFVRMCSLAAVPRVNHPIGQKVQQEKYYYDCLLPPVHPLCCSPAHPLHCLQGCHISSNDEHARIDVNDNVEKILKNDFQGPTVKTDST